MKELHRYRKTYADTLHDVGVSVNTIRIRLGHESLDVTLAYPKGKDAESKKPRNMQTAAAWRCTPNCWSSLAWMANGLL